MAINTFPSSASLTPRKITLTSGSSWTVPAGVTFVNVLLVGGGGGAPRTVTTSGGNGSASSGETIRSYVTTTPGASISYGIGAGGTGGTNVVGPGTGGTTTFTGATSAIGGNAGATGGAGYIEITEFYN